MPGDKQAQETRQLQITNDGSEYGTTVGLHGVPGGGVDGVFEVTWHHKAGERPIATIKAYAIPIDVRMGVEVAKICPACGERLDSVKEPDLG